MRSVPLEQSHFVEAGAFDWDRGGNGFGDDGGSDGFSRHC